MRELHTSAVAKSPHYVRTEKKPYLLEAMVSRLRGHSSASGANVAKEEIDCLERFEKQLEERRVATRAQLDALRERYTLELGEASQRVRGEPAPEASSIHDYTFAETNLVGGER